jgi:hypothetical protein
MRSNLNRAQQRFLGLVGTSHTADHDFQAVLDFCLSKEVGDTFQMALEAPGQFVGGPLFGHRKGGVVTVRYAARNGYTPKTVPDDPLVADESYVLGWADCLASIHSTKCDWVGNWMMYPDRELPDVATDLRWVERARQTRLIDQLHILMVVGWSDARVTARGYTYDHHTGRVGGMGAAGSE